MSLTKYKEKRSFDKIPKPVGGILLSFLFSPGIKGQPGTAAEICTTAHSYANVAFSWILSTVLLDQFYYCP